MEILTDAGEIGEVGIGEAGKVGNVLRAEALEAHRRHVTYGGDGGQQPWDRNWARGHSEF